MLIWVVMFNALSAQPLAPHCIGINKFNWHELFAQSRAHTIPSFEKHLLKAMPCNSTLTLLFQAVSLSSSPQMKPSCFCVYHACFSGIFGLWWEATNEPFPSAEYLSLPWLPKSLSCWCESKRLEWFLRRSDSGPVPAHEENWIDGERFAVGALHIRQGNKM